MDLQKHIESLQHDLTQGVPRSVLDQMNKATEELISYGIAKRAKKLATKIPAATLLDSTCKEVELSTILKRADKTIISFFRGAWCPYCCLELKYYHQFHSLIKERNGQLIAISPQLLTPELKSLDFTVLTDVDNSLARGLGLVFELSKELRTLYQGYGFNLPELNGNNTWSLPMPATYLVDSESNIEKCFIDPDYLQRAEPLDYVTALVRSKSTKSTFVRRTL